MNQLQDYSNLLHLLVAMRNRKDACPYYQLPHKNIAPVTLSLSLSLHTCSFNDRVNPKLIPDLIYYLYIVNLIAGMLLGVEYARRRRFSLTHHAATSSLVCSSILSLSLLLQVVIRKS